MTAPSIPAADEKYANNVAIDNLRSISDSTDFDYDYGLGSNPSPSFDLVLSRED